MSGNYTRDKYVFLSKLYERAEKFEETVKWIKKFIELDADLNEEERNIFATGYKNVISSKRASWRMITLLEKKEKKKNSNLAYVQSLKEVRVTVEAEIKKISDDIISVVDKLLIPVNLQGDDKEGLVFYLKLKGDYYRYKAEITADSEFEKAIFEADKAYQQAYEVSEDELPISSPTRLGLILNLSVFYYEIAGQKEEACEIAKAGFEESMKVLEDLEKSKAKDAILIIQILKENLILWNNEMMDD
jgi:14-3-3 protein epsilon